MTHLLFLDIDGVLTTTHSPHEMVPICVEHLESLLVETEASVIVSSSWRFGGIGPESELQVKLKRVCREMDGHVLRFERIAARLHGVTISLPHRSRQEEIEDYVRRHRPARFAAVDDWPLDFASPAPDWLVLTDPARGLDAEAAARLLARLSR